MLMVLIPTLGIVYALQGCEGLRVNVDLRNADIKAIQMIQEAE